MLRAPDSSRVVEGKVVVDLTSGKNLGVPNSGLSTTKTAPVTSYPIYLGKYDFAETRKQENKNLK